jgi:hypothetical protein
VKRHLFVSTNGEVHYVIEEPKFNQIEVTGTHDFIQIKQRMKNEALKPLFLKRNG